MLIDHRTYTVRPGTMPAQAEQNAKAGNVVQQRNVLMVPAPFAPQPPMPKIVR